MSNGYVVWEGPSQLDNKPIALIITGFDRVSKNPKTGHMIQSWIIRSDIYPLEAVKTNEDESICGKCPFKGSNNEGRSCYVNMRGVGRLYSTYKAGKYPLLPSPLLLRNRALRMGSYGDPAAVPLSVWKPLLNQTFMQTGYTHQWMTCDQQYRNYLMASVETFELANQATQMGWKYFRVKSSADQSSLPTEMICPASEESGHQLTCLQCGNCNGQGKDVVVNVHGTRKANFNFDLSVI